VKEKFRVLKGNWLLNLKKVEFGVNSARSQSTGKTPFEIVLGFIPHFVGLKEDVVNDVVKCNSTAKSIEQERLDEVREASEKAIQ